MKKISWVLIGMMIMLLIGNVMATETGNEMLTEENSGDDFWTIDVADLELMPSEIMIEDEKNLEEEMNEVIKADKGKNIMLFDKELDITGEAKDLILAAGGKVSSKALGSYAFMAASQLDISGEIFKDTFAVGNEIEVDGNIGRDFYALGNVINIDGTVERDVYAGGEELNIRGTVEGDIHFAGGSIFIASDAVIHGALHLIANEIEIRNGATIEGVVHYRSDATQVIIPEGIRTEIQMIEVIQNEGENPIITALKSFLWWTVANFILLAVVMLLFPGMMNRIQMIYREDPLHQCVSSLGWGLLGLLVIPVLSVLLIFTFIGSTIGIIGLLLYTIGYIIATVMTSHVMANAFLQGNQNKYVKGLFGVIVIEALRRLPVIGGIISLIVNAIAFGTVIKLIKKSN